MLKFAPHVIAAVLALGLAGPLHAAGSSDSGASRSTTDDTYAKAVKAVKAEEFRSAVSLLNTVVKEKPDNADALNYLGFSHRKLGDYALAVSYYQRALSLEARHRGANEYLGQAYVEMGNLPAAEERLTALKGICGTGCEEYQSLKKAIDAAVAGKPKQS
ncbi:MAG: tetratricopeptide repeat protein [Rhodospirillaceae bacterium]